eukprot:1159521-Pelagomonas_calceolata.AAC.12
MAQLHEGTCVLAALLLLPVRLRPSELRQNVRVQQCSDELGHLQAHAAAAVHELQQLGHEHCPSVGGGHQGNILAASCLLLLADGLECSCILKLEALRGGGSALHALSARWIKRHRHARSGYAHHIIQGGLGPNPTHSESLLGSRHAWW